MKEYTIYKAGFFIDKEFNFLWASPDGIILEDNNYHSLIEIKFSF